MSDTRNARRGTVPPASVYMKVWRFLQAATWIAGAALVAALVITPDLGIAATWNVLIPVAPALMAVAPGIWRNICPLGTTALLPRHFRLSAARELSPRQQGRLNLIGVVALLAIVPLRHVVMNNEGAATAAALVTLGIVAIVMGLCFEWKSGWCSGLCPVHPVEKLYGFKPLATPPNAHCSLCQRCTNPCPDSVPGFHPLKPAHSSTATWAGTLMVGGFAGYIWGWFQVPDYRGSEGWSHLDAAYGLPFAGLAATLALYLLLRAAIPARHGKLLTRTFAAAAISCYYWYRIPALVGLGPFPGDGMLLDLSGTLPGYFNTVSRIATTAFFFWWLVLRTGGNRAWCVRPAFAEKAAANSV